MTPVSHCWTNKGEFYVGSHEGFLFSVELETNQAHVHIGSDSGLKLIHLYQV